ncbi:MAG TPA: hypothetical protein VK781_02925 [Solirubrobacteraceae bacterium]|jgi:hypothetical protein|nr:hypothetical protein [Solirubrobacteraceae bacterium]
MKKIRMGVALFVVLVSSAVVVAPALAADEFLVDGVAMKAGTEIRFSGGLLLEDMKGGIFGEAVHLTCSSEGLVFADSATEILIVTVFQSGGTDPAENTSGTIKCTTNSGICGEPEVKALHLPWRVLLKLVGTAFRAELLGFTIEEPGWNLTCNKMVEDQCVEPSTSSSTVGVENVESMVNMDFDSVYNGIALNCTRGGLKEGLVEGTLLFEAFLKSLAAS